MQKVTTEDLSFLGEILENVLNLLKVRSKTLLDLINDALLFKKDMHLDYDEQVTEIIAKEKQLISEYVASLEQLNEWNNEELMGCASTIASTKEVKLGEVAGVLRAKLTGRLHAPSIFDMMQVIGKEETLRRLML